MYSSTLPKKPLGARLFLLSALALVLELTLIRWAPSAVVLIAYYANLLLISSFLGLGVGAMLGASQRRVFHWFPALLALDVAILLLCCRLALPAGIEENRFYLPANQAFVNYLTLVLVFVANTAVFVPLGQEIGALFEAMPPLCAYSFDLAGSLFGTVAFAVFSYFCFSPIVAMATVMVLFVVLSRWRERMWSAPVFALTLVPFALPREEPVLWTPYYYLTYAPAFPLPPSDAAPPHAPDAPSAAVGSPIYSVNVNHHFYQYHASLEFERYAPGTPEADFIRELRDMLVLPYALTAGRDRALVLGAGGGIDVEAALIAGVAHVDAVDVDPVVISLARRLNPAKVYDDPRVTPIVEDARAFLRVAEPGYDAVVFGTLDSQTLFSSMSNVRLDGFTHTVESFRSAWSLVKDGGVLCLVFETCGNGAWVGHKVVRMMESATGKPPVTYQSGSMLVACVTRGDPRPAGEPPAESIGSMRRVELDGDDGPLATDDWPYLYLSRRTIPTDYLVVIATLLALSVLAVIGVRGRGFGSVDAGFLHFLFLGAGFLLLQTRSIGDCALYFGSTGFVTALVIAGVLFMVLAANLVAMRIARFRPVLYVPLLVTLAVLCLVPRDLVLSFPFAARIAWTVFAVPLPVFFAGLIFSTTLRTSNSPSVAFGANLVGAMIGGFCEYLGMATGTRALSWIVIAAYVASLLFVLRATRATAGGNRARGSLAAS